MTTEQTTSDERPDAQRLPRTASSSVARSSSRAATSRVVRRPSYAASSNSLPTSGVSNKPMVPTAPGSPTVNPPRPLRRHIGQPLGR